MINDDDCICIRFIFPKKKGTHQPRCSIVAKQTKQNNTKDISIQNICVFEKHTLIHTRNVYKSDKKKREKIGPS